MPFCTWFCTTWDDPLGSIVESPATAGLFSCCLAEVGEVVIGCGDEIDGEVSERVEVVTVGVLDDERGLIALEVFVGQSQIVGGWGYCFLEVEDGDGIIVGDFS